MILFNMILDFLNKCEESQPSTTYLYLGVSFFLRVITMSNAFGFGFQMSIGIKEKRVEKS